MKSFTRPSPQRRHRHHGGRTSGAAASSSGSLPRRSWSSSSLASSSSFSSSSSDTSHSELSSRTPFCCAPTSLYRLHVSLHGQQSPNVSYPGINLHQPMSRPGRCSLSSEEHQALVSGQHVSERHASGCRSPGTSRAPEVLQPAAAVPRHRQLHTYSAAAQHCRQQPPSGPAVDACDLFFVKVSARSQREGRVFGAECGRLMRSVPCVQSHLRLPVRFALW